MTPSVDDRLAVRRRPEGSPVMYQSWGDLLFLHWQVPAELLRKHVPAGLEVDTYEGRAFVGVTPFTLWGVRPVFVPPVPFLSEFHEINVRTYVHLDGVPGVWFFSLDAAQALAVWAARRFFFLPYFNARMSLAQDGRRITYASERTHRGAAPAEFEARWEFGELLAPAEPDSLAFFLTERYCLYAARAEELYRCRVHHQPWPLRRAELSALHSTMVEAAGLPTPSGEPLLHYADELKVDIYPPVRLRRRAPARVFDRIEFDPAEAVPSQN